MHHNEEEILLDHLQSLPLGQGWSLDALSRCVGAGKALGENLARLVRREFKNLALEEILRREGVRLRSVDAPAAEGVQILAEYQAQPPTIRVYPKRIDSTRRNLSAEQRIEIGERLREIALAHELYHHLWQRFLEDDKADSEASSTEAKEAAGDPSRPQQLLHSPLTQEVAALVFTKTYLGLPCLPVL